MKPVDRKFKRDKKLKESEDKSPYGFVNSFDKDSIKKAFIEAQKKEKMPSFSLSKIEIHPSNKCPLNCDFCFGKNIHANSKMKITGKVIDKILNDVKKMKENPFIAISGAYTDPFMSPHTKEIIQIIGKHKLKFGIYTNGIVLDEEAMDIIIAAAKKAKSYKPSYISFNIAGLIRSKDFDKVLEKIKIFNNKRKGFEKKLLINAPILAIFEAEKLKDIIKKLYGAGVDIIKIFTSDKIYDKNFKKSKKVFEREEEVIKELKQEFPNLKQELNVDNKGYEKCFIMTCSLSIDCEGNVYACSRVCSPLFKKEFSYGNILNEKFSNIWNGKKHNLLFKALNPDKAKCFDSCCKTDQVFNILCNNILKEVN